MCVHGVPTKFSAMKKRVKEPLPEGRAFLFSKILSDFCSGVINTLFYAKIDMEEISAFKVTNCLDIKQVNLYSKIGKFSK